MVNEIIQHMIQSKNHQDLMVNNSYYYHLIQALSNRKNVTEEAEALSDTLIAFCEAVKSMENELNEI